MDTGFHAISNEQYHQEDAISKSDLILFNRSPAHYKAKEYKKPTPAMIFGSATHTAILEPEIYAKEYAVLPEDHDGRTTKGKAIKAEIEAEKQIPISFVDVGRIGEMRKSILTHYTASRLIYDKGPAEISGFWVDRATGLECKSRPDKIISDSQIVVDLKTTEDARLEPFMKSLASLKYHWQAAHYLNGVTEITGIPHQDFVVVAIEKDPPYAVAVYRLDNAAVYLAGEEIKILLNEFQECKKDNNWPAYLPDEIQPISLPDWYMKGINL